MFCFGQRVSSYVGFLHYFLYAALLILILDAAKQSYLLDYDGVALSHLLFAHLFFLLPTNYILMYQLYDLLLVCVVCCCLVY